MTEVLAALYQILITDQVLRDKLTQHNGQPAIFYGLAPTEAKMPYVVTDVVSSNPEASHAVERMVFAVNVFDLGGSPLRALEICQRIEYLLDQERPNCGRLTNLGIWRDTKGVISDEPGIQHVHLEFVVRYGREDLVK